MTETAEETQGKEITKQKKLVAKLFEIQKEIGAIVKDSTNPYYNSKYFDINKLLDTVKPMLNEHGILLMQPLNTENGKTVLMTQLTDTESNEIISTSAILPENPDPQKMGSIITYYRRYSLQSLLALQATDDDAEIAAHGNPNLPEPVKLPQRLSEKKAPGIPKSLMGVPGPELHHYRIESLDECKIQGHKKNGSNDYAYYTLGSGKTGFIFTINDKKIVDAIIFARDKNVGILLKVDPKIKDKKLVIDFEPL